MSWLEQRPFTRPSLRVGNNAGNGENIKNGGANAQPADFSGAAAFGSPNTHRFGSGNGLYTDRQ
jgi:hypothetical protein